MARTPQYQQLLDKLESGGLNEIERKILEALLKAPKGLTRQGLIRIVFTVEPHRNLVNDPHDRKIRKGIESLRNRMIPIISSSGEAGYRLDTSPDAIENMVLEWESRITHLQQKVQIARQHYGLP
jgi:DNA-binding response OmpR family regulator